MSEPKTLTYEQWLARTGRKPTFVTCDECQGRGEYACGECGQQTYCGFCDGRGKWDETLLDYEGQRDRDLARWKELQAVGSPTGHPQT